MEHRVIYLAFHSSADIDAIENEYAKSGIRAEVIPVDVSLGAKIQAIGYWEAFRRALENIRMAMAECRDSEALYAAVTNAMVKKGRVWYSIFTIQILDRHGIICLGTWTKHVMVLDSLVENVFRRGFAPTTLHQVLVEHYGAETDPYLLMTYGARTYRDLLVDAMERVPDRRWLDRT